jgi:hypothetical protein
MDPDSGGRALLAPAPLVSDSYPVSTRTDEDSGIEKSHGDRSVRLGTKTAKSMSKGSSSRVAFGT